MQYASQYTKSRGELTRLANPYIVRTFPKVSANPGGPTFGKYCKCQLIKFKPWEGKPSNAWDDNEETDDIFINTYGLFLQTDFAKVNVFGYSVEKEMVLAAQQITHLELMRVVMKVIMMLNLTLMVRSKLKIGCCCAESMNIMGKREIK